MNARFGLVLFALIGGVISAFSNAPHIGYAFPAGGQQGQVFEASIGGQYLAGATNVFVSGGGVHVEIEHYSVKYEPQRLRQFYNRLRNLRAGLVDKEGTKLAQDKKRIAQIEQQLKLMDLPEDVDVLNHREVQRYFRSASDQTKEQFNPQIAHRLKVRITIDKEAEPGERELRVYTPEGLSNPIYFQVGVLNEVLETEPNDDHMSPKLIRVELPAVLNGQVRPGDIDHFRFRANQGDSIVVDVGARRIIPYLADAVPGWFQAVVALYDEDGNEVAYQDDYKFNPDPVLFFDVPENGTYTLSIRDSIYRGREDFIYRIAIGELPFITGIFPLGAQQGMGVDIALSGRNLPKTRLTGKLPSDGTELRHISVKAEGYRSNQMPFAVSDVKEGQETEPNSSHAEAQRVGLPLVVNGRIQQVGDRDVYRFQGAKGDSVSIEVTARRLNSSLDSVLTLSGPGLEKAVRNDDYVNKDKTHLHLGAGLVTHHADSYIEQTLPETGTYFIEVGDAQSKGGHDYAYRLRISKSQPDFRLRMEPSGLKIAPGGTAVFTIRASRLEGFEEMIELKAENLPAGFSMSEAVIAADSDTARFTLTAPKTINGEMVNPQIVGVGKVNGRLISRPAIPVDDQMQAFLFRHLVPARELVLAPVEEEPAVSFEARIPKSGFIELPAGKTTRIMFSGSINISRRGCPIKLDHPPEGFSTEKNGWMNKQKRGDKDKNGKVRFEETKAVGSLLVSVDESISPGTRLSLLVAAEVRSGKDSELYPAPAIPVKVVKARK